jgi:nucleoside-diphosphate-sugar epimerase
MRVAILGCGYVGITLGEQLVDAGHEAIGVRRSAAGCQRLEAAGIDPLQGDLTDRETLDRLAPVDAVAFLATPDDRDAEAARALHVDGLRTVIDALAAAGDPPERLVYSSTTGVYGDHDGAWVDEASELRPPTEKTRVIAEAERITWAAGDRGIDGRVVRFAGLYGPDRHRLDRYLDGPVTEGWLNLLHRADAATVTRALCTGAVDADCLLAVDDEPVHRPALARWLAEQRGVDPPAAQSVADRLRSVDDPARAARIRADKRCSNDRLRDAGIELEFPTYREGYGEILAAWPNEQD